MIAITLKPYIWIKSVNPSYTFLLHEPWCGDIPIAYKPTYINMNLDLNLINCGDLCYDSSWDLYRLSLFFGPSAEMFLPNLGGPN